SRLKTITMTGRKGAGSLPTLSFRYGSAPTPSVVKASNVDGWVLNERGTSLLDVDGDGLPDLLSAELGSHQYRRNRGDGTFDPAKKVTGAESVYLDVLRYVDLDGDARPELVTVVSDTWRSLHLTGTQWQPPKVVKGTKYLGLTQGNQVLVDVNGDGKIDVLR